MTEFKYNFNSVVRSHFERAETARVPAATGNGGRRAESEIGHALGARRPESFAERRRAEPSERPQPDAVDIPRVHQPAVERHASQW